MDRQNAAPKCSPAECEITLTKVVTLTDRGHSGILPDYSFFVIQDRVGRFVTAARTRDRLVVFDKNGTIQSVVGKPGDFMRIANVLPGLDHEFFVYDYQLRRVSLVGSDMKVGRILPIAYSPAFIREDGKYIVAQQIPTAELIGYPIHLVDAEGRVLRSFGTETPQFRNDLRLVTNRVVAPGRDGSVWAAAPGQYVFERWDPVSGTKLGRVVVQSTWFTTSTTAVTDERVRPRPLLQGAWDREGLLWTLVRDADSRWTPPLRPNAERPFNLDEHNQTFDWIVEAIEPVSGRVVASRRFPTVHWGRSPSPFIVSWGGKTNNVAQFDVWRLELRTKEVEK